MSDQHEGMARVSRTALGPLRDQLTIKGFDPQEREHWIRETWVAMEGSYGIPRAFAFANDFTIEAEEGYELDGPPKRPQFDGKWGYQEKPVSEIVQAFREGYHDLILQAYTGSGKTVMGCEIAARLGRSTLILVDQTKLKEQWIETLMDHFGYDPDEIGIVQGDEYEYEWDFTIGMIQSVYNREHLPEFYQAFGTVIYDECHVAGADQFSRVLEMFPARYRLGLSATPDRKDSLDKLVKLHLESNRVTLLERREKSRVYVVQYPGTYSWYGNTSPKTGRFVSEVTEDGERNLMLAEIIKWFHDKDRKALIIGERIHHLECLAAIAIRMGVPEDDILLYTGKENYYKLEKDPNPQRDPSGYVKGTEYTPLHFIQKERRVKLPTRDHLLRERKLIFSTYSVFSKGVDVPDLDTGMDVTPKSSFVQEHGRILRGNVSGKRIPIWVTIRDFNSSRAEYQFSKRIAEFVKSNAETFIWPTPGEAKLVRVAPAKLRKEAEWRREKLKKERITTDAGGNFTIQTMVTEPEYYDNSVRRTTKTGRSRRSSRRAS